MATTLAEKTTNQWRAWWYRAMTDPNPDHRAEALEHLRAFTDAKSPIAHSQAERLELGIMEGILSFIEMNFNPVQEENRCSDLLSSKPL